MTILSGAGNTSYIPANSTAAASTPSLGQSLLNAVNSSSSVSGNSPSVQDVVALNADSSIVSTLPSGASSQAYTPQGLLNSYYNFMESNIANDPLLQSSSDSSSSADALSLPSLVSSGNSGSNIAALEPSVPNTSQATGGSALLAQSSSSLNINSNWASILQKDPSLAYQVTEGLFNQGIVNTLA